MTNGNLSRVTDADFDSKVLQADRPVLIDFWAAWCGPCKMVAPVLDEIAREQAEKLHVYKLDVDANHGTAFRYGVQSIPTMILFKDGEEAARIVGFMPKDRILAKIRPHFSE